MLRYIIVTDKQFIGENAVFISNDQPERFLAEFSRNYGFSNPYAAENTAKNNLKEHYNIIPADV